MRSTINKSYELIFSYYFYAILIPVIFVILKINGTYFSIPETITTYFIVFYFYYRKNKTNLNSFPIVKNLSLKSYFFIFILVFLFLPSIYFSSTLASAFFHNPIPDVIDDFKIDSFFTIFIAIALLPAVFEEFLMRCFFLSNFEKVPVKTKAIINGFFFALLHGNLHQFIYSFFIGIILTYLVIYTGSIFSSILFHLVFNSIGVLTIFFDKEYSTLLDVPDLSEIINELAILFLISLICIKPILYFLNKLKLENNYKPIVIDDFKLSTIFTKLFFVTITFMFGLMILTIYITGNM